MIALAVFLSYFIQTTLNVEVIVSLPLVILASTYPIYNKNELFLSVMIIIYLELLISPASCLRILLTYVLVLVFLLVRKMGFLSNRRKLIDGLIVQAIFLLGLIIYPFQQSIWIATSVLIVGLVMSTISQFIVNSYFRESGELSGY